MTVLTSGSVMTEQQAIDKVVATFNHDVKKFPLHGPDNTPTGYFGLFDKNFKIIGTKSVTEDYYVHTCDDMVALATAAIRTYNGVCDVRCSFNNGHGLIIAPPLEVRKAIYGTADNIFGRLILKAPYVSGCVDAAFGFWRDLCDNMSMLQTVSQSHFKIRHTKGLTDKMEELKREFHDLSKGWNLVQEAVGEMEQKRVSLKDFLADVYGTTTEEMGTRKIKNHEDRTAAVFNRVLEERRKAGRGSIGTDWNVSAWEAYNGVQGYQQHTAKRPGLNIDQRIWRGFEDTLTAKAERVALLSV